MDAHLRDLRYFTTVAEELSFTRAAERLHLSQPALSKQVRALEAALRARLFERDPRGVRLTSAGEELLVAARRLLAEWDRAVPSVSEAAAHEARVIRVGTQTSIGRALYPKIVDRFAASRPGWQIELRSFSWTDPTAGLRDRRTDAAFLWLPIEDEGLEVETLLTEQRCVAVGAGHRLARRRKVRFVDLAGEAFVAMPRSAGALRDFWLGADDGRTPTVQVAGEAESADETFELVSAGAVHLVAEGNAVLYQRPGVVCIPVTDLRPAQLSVAWRRDDRRDAVQAFVRACVEAAIR